MNRAVVYMIGSALGFSVMSVLVKITSETLPTGEIVLARGVVTLALSYAMLARTDLAIWGNDRGRLVWRGVLGFGGLTCYYASLAHLPPGSSIIATASEQAYDPSAELYDYAQTKAATMNSTAASCQTCRPKWASELT